MIFGGKKKPRLEDLVSALMGEPIPELAKVGHDGRLETVRVELVLALISHPEPAKFHRFASEAIRVCLDEHAMLIANSGGLLQFTVRSSTGEGPKTSNGEELAAALAKVLGTDARIVYGHVDAHVGTVGTERRKTWGIHPVAMERILGSLLVAVPGEPQRLKTE